MLVPRLLKYPGYPTQHFRCRLAPKPRMSCKPQNGPWKRRNFSNGRCRPPPFPRLLGAVSNAWANEKSPLSFFARPSVRSSQSASCPTPAVGIEGSIPRTRAKPVPALLSSVCAPLVGGLFLSPACDRAEKEQDTLCPNGRQKGKRFVSEIIQRIAPYLKRTEILRSRSPVAMAGKDPFFKTR